MDAKNNRPQIQNPVVAPDVVVNKTDSLKSVDIIVEVLEPRLLYSSDPMGIVLALLPPDINVESIAQIDADIASLVMATDSVALDTPAGGQVSDVIFLDSRLDDPELLRQVFQEGQLEGRQPLIIMINGDDDASSIANHLSRFENLDSIQLISHADSSGVSLGSTWLNGDNLMALESEITAWGDALTDDGDILFYGCSLAAESEGRVLLTRIAELTGADIAASVNLTGHPALGADWRLEYQNGEIESEPVALDDLQSNWRSLLTPLTVTTTDDVVDATAPNLTSVASLIANPGADGFISLREAIIATNADTGADEITLASDQYSLTLAGAGDNGDLDITDDLTILGQGIADTIVDAGGIDRVFQISGSTVTLSNLTLTGGVSPNGENGGGILLDSGSLLLTHVSVDNSTTDGGFGGGMYVAAGASLVATDSTITNNTGDLANAPTYRGGGGIHSLGSITLDRVSLENNTGKNGGAIHSHGFLQLTDVWIVGNTASENAGGIDNHDVSANLVMDRVTFEANIAGERGGALRNTGVATISTTTFSANSAGTLGGAITDSGSSTLIENSTFFGNTASDTGGAISVTGGNLDVRNTIFASNTDSSGNNAIEGAFTSLGFNLAMDPDFAGSADTDLVGVDPNLGSLQFNGGYVKTHAPGAGSAAINAGKNGGTTDATGLIPDELRDIGAVEYRLGESVAKIFWTDQTEKAIYRANADGTAVQKIVTTTENPFDIEVDIVGGKIYWVEAQGDYISDGGLGSLMSADLDGSNVITLVAGLLYPTGLALDIPSGYVYVTHDASLTNSSTPYINRIVRYNMDGTNEQVIAAGQLGDPGPSRMVTPTDIEFDPTTNTLYWSDRGRVLPIVGLVGEEIMLLDLAVGAPGQQVIGNPANASHSPHGIAVLPGGDLIYWANTEGISLIDSTGGPVVESDSGVISGGRILGIQYSAANDTLYLTDQAGFIRSISADLSSNTILLSGLTDPTALAIATTSPVSLGPVVTATGMTIAEGGTLPLSAANVSVSDPDTLSTELTYNVTINPQNGELLNDVGTSVLSFTQAQIDAGEISYRHFGGEDISDSFTFTVTDAVSTTAATLFSISITPQNDAPVAVANVGSLAEGGTVNLDLASNDSDVDDGLDLASIVITGAPANGSVTVLANGTVDYTHDGSATISDSFNYSIDDLSGLTSNIVTVSLTISPVNVNNAPVAVIDSFTVAEGATANLALIANDTDADDGLDPGSITISSGPANGSVTVQANGTVDYTHDGSETISDSFSYSVDDIGGNTSNIVTVSLTISPVNDAPVAVIDSFTVAEGATANLALIINGQYHDQQCTCQRQRDRAGQWYGGLHTRWFRDHQRQLQL